MKISETDSETFEAKFERFLDDGFENVSLEDTGSCFPWQWFALDAVAKLSSEVWAESDAWDFLQKFLSRDIVLQIHLDWYRSLGSQGQAEVDESSEGFYRRKPLERNLPKVRELRRAVKDAIAAEAQHRDRSAVWERIVQEWKNDLGLSDAECRILGMALVMSQNREVKSFFETGRNLSVPKISEALDLPVQTLIRAFSSKSKLKTIGLASDFFELDDGWAQALYHGTWKENILDSVAQQSGSGFDLKSFRLGQADEEFLLEFLKRPEPCNLLIYGPPGTGKSELARSLAQSAGLNAYSLENPGVMESRSRRGTGVTAAEPLVAARSLQGKNAVLILDEAEPFLSSQAHSFFKAVDAEAKARVNALLESMTGKTIWIVNHLDLLDESALRRFNFVLAMPQPTASRNLDSWLYHAERVGLDPGEWKTVFQQASRRFTLPPALIERVVRNLSLVRDFTVRSKDAALNHLVMSYIEAGYGKAGQASGDKPFDLDVLVCKPEAGDLFESLAARVSNPRAPAKGQRLLFWGPPGTGKSELARQIALKLDREFKLIRPSDILSMWVGENERNIRKAFQTASKVPSVLVFDEIDTFLMNREKAGKSWELSMVNEFLIQLETFEGILVGTTNGLERLDPAVLRRFQTKVEFGYLEPAGCSSLAIKYFPELGISEPEVWTNLPPLTPGDFAAVADSALRPASVAELFEALKAEAALRKPAVKPIGF
ncbi:MAG: ATP-binding protein [Spirochaetales bacterium]|nr:ATP-binding protein [Spirochaetales bacterium]